MPFMCDEAGHCGDNPYAALEMFVRGIATSVPVGERLSTGDYEPALVLEARRLIAAIDAGKGPQGSAVAHWSYRV